MSIKMEATLVSGTISQTVTIDFEDGFKIVIGQLAGIGPEIQLFADDKNITDDFRKLCAKHNYEFENDATGMLNALTYVREMAKKSYARKMADEMGLTELFDLLESIIVVERKQRGG